MMAETTRHAVTHATRARDELLIGALLAGNTFANAAKAAGISRRTAYRMRQSEEFQAKYRAAKDELLGAAVAALHGRALAFIETLGAIAADTKMRGSERVQASREGLAALFKGVELFDFEERLRKLEAVANGGRN
jgi:hypothetical protein